ncbi:hypothetical protein HDV01_001708 [Terramyces sp. JEL0728]|nr:hypothetical protein HDV01_001708 [Terramyces sp. JEL0728]
MVRASDVFVGFAMQVCIFISWFDLLTMLNKPTRLACTADSVILPITFSIYYGLMFIKNYRMYMIFTRPTRRVLKTHQTIAVGAVFALPAAIIIAIWHAIDSPKPAALAVVKGVYAWTCSSTSTSVQSDFVAALAVYCGVILALNLFIAFQTRNVPSKYNETKLITISIYNTAIVTLFAISLLLSQGLGFRLKAGVKMFAEFYVLYFNLISTFMVKVVQCAKGQGLTTRSFGHSSQSQSQTGNTKEENKTAGSKDAKKPKAGTPVLFKKGGIFATSTPRILTSESGDIVSFCRFTKITLEDRNPTRRGDGECWKLSNLQGFKVDAISKTSRKYFLDFDVFEIVFENEEDTKFWDQYFHSWANKHASHSLMGETMMK